MPADDDDDSITNLTDNVEKYKRDTQSLCSNQGAAILESDSDDEGEQEESEESENPFLSPK